MMLVIRQLGEGGGVGGKKHYLVLIHHTSSSCISLSDSMETMSSSPRNTKLSQKKIVANVSVLRVRRAHWISALLADVPPPRYP